MIFNLSNYRVTDAVDLPDGGRRVLREALGYVREGDTFVVASIDRLARSVRDISAGSPVARACAMA